MSEYTMRPARYAKGKVEVETPSTTGIKSRAARLAEALGGRWVNRSNAYIMSPGRAAKLRELFDAGWDATFIGRKLIQPKEVK